jgi:hypothetical protein
LLLDSHHWHGPAEPPFFVTAPGGIHKYVCTIDAHVFHVLQIHLHIARSWAFKLDRGVAEEGDDPAAFVSRLFQPQDQGMHPRRHRRRL